jgi:hypothetical protein
VECWRPSLASSSSSSYSYKHRTWFFESVKQFFLLFPENKSCIHAQAPAVTARV